MTPEYCTRTDKPRGRYRCTSDWVLRNQPLLAGITLLITVLAILYDIYLVWALNQPTISRQVWTATEEQPALVVGGVFATLGICWLIRTYWGLVLFMAFLGGHLFAHG